MDGRHLSLAAQGIINRMIAEGTLLQGTIFEDPKTHRLETQPGLWFRLMTLTALRKSTLPSSSGLLRRLKINMEVFKWQMDAIFFRSCMPDGAIDIANVTSGDILTVHGHFA